MTPLTTSGPRRRPRRRVVVLALASLVVLLGTGAGLYLLGSAGALGGRLDRSTVTTNGLRAPVPARERNRRLAPVVDLAAGPQLAVRLKDPPRAGLLFDMDSGRVLWSRRPLDVLPIASLTKMMTALLVAERTSARDKAKITRSALDYSGSGVGVLPRGRRVPIEALLSGMLLVSGNDAAIALADHVAGSQRAFVDLMNRRAAELGLRCSHFSSAHGLEASNRSCAADLAALARLDLRQSRIARIVRRRQASIRFPIAGGHLYLNSTNPLLRLRYPGTIGLKTGYTARAGHNFVGVVHRGDRTLGVVLLHSSDTGRQAEQLFDRVLRPARRDERSRRSRPAPRTEARKAGGRPKLGG